MLLGHAALTHLLRTLVNNLACDFRTDGVFKTKLGCQCAIPTKAKGISRLKPVASLHQEGLLPTQGLTPFRLSLSGCSQERPQQRAGHQRTSAWPEATVKIIWDVKSRRLMTLFSAAPSDCYQLPFSCSVVLLFCD